MYNLIHIDTYLISNGEHVQIMNTLYHVDNCKATVLIYSNIIILDIMRNNQQSYTIVMDRFIV